MIYGRISKLFAIGFMFLLLFLFVCDTYYSFSPHILSTDTAMYIYRYGILLKPPPHPPEKLIRSMENLWKRKTFIIIIIIFIGCQ